MSHYWLLVLLFSCSTVFSCIVPPISNGYLFSDGEILQEGEILNYSGLVSVKCNQGFGVLTHTEADNLVQCDEETDAWNKQFLSCQKSCKRSDLIDYTGFPVNCKYSNGRSFTCPTENFAIGASAKVQCNQGYKYKNLGDPEPFICRSDGTWSQPTYRCDAICGQQTAKSTLFLSHGKEAQETEAPWNVAVYKRNGKDFNLICGGTILTERVVISAAHCFYVEESGRVTLNHIGTFSVIPGKVARDFNENGAFERQVFGVAKIVKDRNYNGKSSYNRGDLAFVVLDNLIKYQVNVAPICLNPENDGWALQTGQKATVFGWGFTTSSGAPSEVLRTLVVPYMPLEKCRENATDVFRPFILDDKLCFGDNDIDSGVCKGDSGAGLVTSKMENGLTKFYLRGIVSLGETSDDGCNFAFYDVYTDIEKYIKEIYKFLLAYPATPQAVKNLNEENQRNHVIRTTTPPNVLYSNGGDPCTVPKTPHGRVTYGVDTPTHDATLWPGQLHYDFDPVHLICDWEASPSNTDPVELLFIFCINGGWSSSFPTCTKPN